MGRVNQTLKYLNVRDNPIGNDGAKAFTDSIRVNETLTVLGLEYNQIRNDGARALAEALCHNATITWLRLDGNYEIDYDIINEIEKMEKKTKRGALSPDNIVGLSHKGKDIFFLLIFILNQLDI